MVYNHPRSFLCDLVVHAGRFGFSGRGRPAWFPIWCGVIRRGTYHNNTIIATLCQGLFFIFKFIYRGIFMGNVYAVKDIEFSLSVKGRDGQRPADFATVTGMETFSVSFDNGMDEWRPLDQKGWAKRLVTTKSLTVSLSGKRVFGCVGNDYVAGLGFEGGAGTQTVLWARFPSGDELFMPCVVNVSGAGGGGAADVAELAFDCLSDGVPMYTRGVDA